MEQTSNLVAYLRTRSGGKEVLTPKQLEPILGISIKQQSLLRKENKLGFPYLTIGGKILYSIHAVAEMLTRPTQTAPATPETAKNEKPSASKSKAVDTAVLPLLEDRTYCIATLSFTSGSTYCKKIICKSRIF